MSGYQKLFEDAIAKMKKEYPFFTVGFITAIIKDLPINAQE